MRISNLLVASILTIFGTIVPAFAQNAGGELSSLKIRRPFLYKITGGKSASYLFGSFHYGLSIDQLPSWVLALHNTTEVHAYEMPSATTDEAKRYLEASQKLYDAPESVAQMMAGHKTNSPEATARLTVFGVPRVLAPYYLEENSVSVWSACDVSVFSDLLFAQKFHSLDDELELRSHGLEKKIIGLDTVELRVAADTAGNQGQVSTCNLKDFPLYDVLRAREALTDDIRKYAQGDEPDLIEDSEETSYRNINWATNLKELLKQNSMFIVVGNRHLFGKRGLIELLRARGFKVERVKSAVQAAL